MARLEKSFMDVIDAKNHLKNYEGAVPVITGAAANAEGPVSSPPYLLYELILFNRSRYMNSSITKSESEIQNIIPNLPKKNTPTLLNTKTSNVEYGIFIIRTNLSLLPGSL